MAQSVTSTFALFFLSSFPFDVGSAGGFDVTDDFSFAAAAAAAVIAADVPVVEGAVGTVKYTSSSSSVMSPCSSSV